MLILFSDTSWVTSQGITANNPSLLGSMSALNLEEYSGDVTASIPILTGELFPPPSSLVCEMPLLSGDISIIQEPYIKDISGNLPIISGSFIMGGNVVCEMPVLAATFGASTPLIANILSVNPSLVGHITGSGYANAEMPNITGHITAIVPVSSRFVSRMPLVSGDISGSIKISANISTVMPVLLGDVDVLTADYGPITAIVPLLTGSIKGDININIDMVSVMPVIGGYLSGVEVEPFNIAASMPVVYGNLLVNHIHSDVVLQHVRGDIR